MSHWNLWCVMSVWSGSENRKIHINTLCTGEDPMGFFRPVQTSKWLTVFPELGHKLVSWLVQQRGYIVIQRIHVLHKPFISFIVHLSKNSDLCCLSTKNAFMCFYICKKQKSKMKILWGLWPPPKTHTGKTAKHQIRLYLCKFGSRPFILFPVFYLIPQCNCINNKKAFKIHSQRNGFQALINCLCSVASPVLSDS